METIRTLINDLGDRRLKLHRDASGSFTYSIDEYIRDDFEPHWTPVRISSSSWFNDLQAAILEIATRHPEFGVQLNE